MLVNYNHMAEKSFKDIAVETAEILEIKNRAYGNSFNKTSEFLKLLFPDGVVDDQYCHLMYIIRVLDKIGRIANSSLLPPEEGIIDAYKDINGYTTLMLKMLYDSIEKQKAEAEEQEDETTITSG